MSYPSSSASRDSLFRILQAANLFEVKYRRRRRNTQNHKLTTRFFIFFTAIFVLALFQRGLIYFIDIEWLRVLSLVTLLISYLGFLLLPILTLTIHRKVLFSFILNPFGALLDNAAETALVDAKYFTKLKNKPLNTIELVSIELKEEQKFFERRIMLIVGAIEKLGLFPGLLAAFLAITQLPGSSNQWVIALAYATPVLYLFGAYAHFTAMRLSRLNALLELVIEEKKAALKHATRVELN